ncbi:hypothetical protein GF337_05025 [candidate division KSB1 bacterium]|nr:hypothetical protein [candidate division KSB1 bacterium]
MNERYFSRELGPLGQFVQDLAQKYAAIWWDSSTALPLIKNRYTTRNQSRIASELEELIERLRKAEHKNGDAINQSRTKMIKPHLERISQWSGIRLDREFSTGFNRSSKRFLELVEDFDPSMKPENIYQAMRNVWIMNSLQYYMKTATECTIPVFAYSMLYPYTDNILDDPALSLETKLAIKLKLKYWLEGRDCTYESDYQEKLFRLVEMIEQHFPRRRYPGVFQSMLTIYNAQIRSLIQQRAHSVPYDVDILNISLEKGGTSVLADGYLIRGEMSPAEADFSFGFGAFLQFADDIQDIPDDLARGQMTMFSQLADKYPLDALANKLLNFIRSVTLMHLSRNEHGKLIDLIIDNCDFLVIEAVARNRRFYSDDYLDRVQQYFPLRFTAFDDLTARLKRTYRSRKSRKIPARSVFSALVKMGLNGDEI